MDNSKVQTVTEWPLPKTVKKLQWFLGFPIHPQLQFDHNPPNFTFKSQIHKTHVEPRGSQSLWKSQDQFYHSPHSETSRSQTTLHGGSGRLRLWYRCSTLTMTWQSRQATSMCCLLAQTGSHKKGTMMWAIKSFSQWRQQKRSGVIGLREPFIPSRLSRTTRILSIANGPKTGPLVLILHPLQFFCHLSTWQQES